MERTLGLKEGPLATLLGTLGAAASRLGERLFARKPHPDPDLEQIFSDSIEREMMYREIHCR
jgi:hypothetical protein